MFILLIFFLLFFSVLLSFFILFLFFLGSNGFLFLSSFSSGFECGFTSYYYSRLSFSVHFFLISIIFLFLDLELCFVILFFIEGSNFFTLFLHTSFFILLLLFGLLLEWYDSKIDWIS